MERRSFLRASVVASGAVLAGCLGDDSNTVLDGPEMGDVDPEALVYPAHGQELPEVTLPAPLHDRDVSTTEYVGERETLLTFIFTRCPGPCPGLTVTLSHVQLAAMEQGYADEVALMPTTFDPAYDDADRLKEFSERNGADPTAENWLFLRPSSPEEADEHINDTFGVGFEEVPVEDSPHDDHDHEGEGHEHDSEDHDGETLDPDEGETTFSHLNLVLLVNRDGYVERAYQRVPRPDEVLDDLETVRDAY